MNAAAMIAIPEELSETQRAALVNLLADEDPAIYETVRKKILSFGPRATNWLRPHLLSSDPALRRRAQAIVLHFERMAADNRFLAFCVKNGQEFDLEQAGWLLAQTCYPEINLEGYRALLDGYAEAIRERLAACAEPKSILTKINRYLFSELGITGHIAPPLLLSA